MDRPRLVRMNQHDDYQVSAINADDCMSATDLAQVEGRLSQHIEQGGDPVVESLVASRQNDQRPLFSRLLGARYWRFQILCSRLLDLIPDGRSGFSVYGGHVYIALPCTYATQVGQIPLHQAEGCRVARLELEGARLISVIQQSVSLQWNGPANLRSCLLQPRGLLRVPQLDRLAWQPSRHRILPPLWHCLPPAFTAQVASNYCRSKFGCQLLQDNTQASGEREDQRKIPHLGASIRQCVTLVRGTIPYCDSVAGFDQVQSLQHVHEAVERALAAVKQRLFTSQRSCEWSAPLECP